MGHKLKLQQADSAPSTGPWGCRTLVHIRNHWLSPRARQPVPIPAGESPEHMIWIREAWVFRLSHDLFQTVPRDTDNHWEDGYAREEHSITDY